RGEQLAGVRVRPVESPARRCVVQHAGRQGEQPPRNGARRLCSSCHRHFEGDSDSTGSGESGQSVADRRRVTRRLLLAAGGAREGRRRFGGEVSPAPGGAEKLPLTVQGDWDGRAWTRTT